MSKRKDLKPETQPGTKQEPPATPKIALPKELIDQLFAVPLRDNHISASAHAHLAESAGS